MPNIMHPYFFPTCGAHSPARPHQQCVRLSIPPALRGCEIGNRCARFRPKLTAAVLRRSCCRLLLLEHEEAVSFSALRTGFLLVLPRNSPNKQTPPMHDKPARVPPPPPRALYFAGPKPQKPLDNTQKEGGCKMGGPFLVYSFCGVERTTQKEHNMFVCFLGGSLIDSKCPPYCVARVFWRQSNRTSWSPAWSLA